jgi:hypothetical protein
MSKFTPGKWEYEGAVPFRIKSKNCSQIALVLQPADARLIAAAPDLYELVMDELLGKAGGILSFAREAKIKAVLDRIDGKEQE